MKTHRINYRPGGQFAASGAPGFRELALIYASTVKTRHDLGRSRGRRGAP
jgi:hypothetical protein